MSNLTMNQVGVINNQYQHFQDHKRVVTVCSAGCLRSPTAAVVLAADPFNFNTRAAGLTDEYAIIPLSDSLMIWADEFVVMEPPMVGALLHRFEKSFGRPLDVTLVPVHCLEIPDNFAYRDPRLVELIQKRYREVTSE